MTRVLVDTSAYSAFFRGHAGVKALFQKVDEIVLSPIVLGELRAGFIAGARRRKNEHELELFLKSLRVSIAPVDEETSERYAAIVHGLRVAGTPVPTNDIWIAASAMQHGLRVVTGSQPAALRPCVAPRRCNPTMIRFIEESDTDEASQIEDNRRVPCALGQREANCARQAAQGDSIDRSLGRGVHQLRNSSVSPRRCSGRWVLRNGERMFVLSVQWFDTGRTGRISPGLRPNQVLSSFSPRQTVAGNPRPQAD